MLREFLDRLLELKSPPTIEIGEQTYWTSGKRILDPYPSNPVGLTTLTGLIGYVDKVKKDESVGPSGFLVVQSPVAVGFYKHFDDFREDDRVLLAAAMLPDPTHPLETEKFYPLERFLILLQSQTVPSKERALLLRILGNVTDEVARTEKDDGVTQAVTVRAGLTLAAEEPAKIQNPVTLAPYRTFPDIDQPASPFILRLRGSEEKQAALFEADGGKWRSQAIASIVSHLEKALPTVQVIG